MSKYNSYRDILQSIYNLKKRRNPSYSLVAFSRDCGFKSNHISDVLAGRYPLSVKRAHEVSRRLNFNNILHDKFIALVTVEHSKDRISVQNALETLNRDNSSSTVILNEGDFSIISDWYYLAILEIYRNERNRMLSPKEISDKLNISVSIAQKAITKLLEQKYLSLLPESGYKANIEYIAVRSSSKSSTTIRSFHKQILMKALDSIDNVSTDKRHIQTFVAELSEKDFSLFANDLARFIKKRIEEIQETKSSGIVHSIGFQIMPLEKI